MASPLRYNIAEAKLIYDGRYEAEEMTKDKISTFNLRHQEVLGFYGLELAEGTVFIIDDRVNGLSNLGVFRCKQLRQAVILAAALPAAAVVLDGFGSLTKVPKEHQTKSLINQLKRYNDLGRYLSPKLAEKILSSGGTLGTEPQRKMMTVLFTDIRNFSTLTDSLEPEELFHLLDKYLSEMTSLIHHYEGTLNKIIGDGMLIFFGDPIPIEDHAQRSVLMAIDMQKKVFELRDEWHHYGYDLAIGIGINTGYMTVGDIGSEVHRDYTVLGNQVNVAARLVSLAKPGQILISQRTYSKTKDLIEVEDMGEIQVKGIHQLIKTFNVVIPS